MPMKKNKYDFSDLLDEKDVAELTEQDFFTTFDNRYLESYVEDIEDGDNFAEYCESFFEMLDEEDYWD